MSPGPIESQRQAGWGTARRAGAFCLLGLFLLGLVSSGCVTNGSNPKTESTLASPVLSGKVLRYYPAGRYLVIQFPPGSMPEKGQLMPVYRKDFRIGEIKITGPQLEDTIAADLVAGEAEAGDAVRSR